MDSLKEQVKRIKKTIEQIEERIGMLEGLLENEKDEEIYNLTIKEIEAQKEILATVNRIVNDEIE